MEVRRILEVQAIRLACERRSPADLDALGRVLVATEAEIAAERPIADMDYQFHMAIFRATQNMIFVRVVNPFYLLSRTRRQAFFHDKERGRISHTQHVEIVSTIRAQDADGGAALMSNHIGRVRTILSRSECDREHVATRTEDNTIEGETEMTKKHGRTAMVGAGALCAALVAGCMMPHGAAAKEYTIAVAMKT